VVEVKIEDGQEVRMAEAPLRGDLSPESAEVFSVPYFSKNLYRNMALTQ
jgi:hypothetical protein